MKRTLVSLMVSVPLVAGCSTTRQTQLDSDASLDVAESKPADPCPHALNGAGVNGAGINGASVDELTDEQGCALFSRVLDEVRFEPGQSVLNVEARRGLDKLIDDLNRHPEVMIQLQGHTDNRGSAADNLALSKERVLAVVRYLVVNGVDGRRLQPYGYGEARPRVSNVSEAGRELNRRIEIRRIQQVSENSGE